MPELDRRTFLAGVAAVPVAAALPAIPIQAVPAFYEYYLGKWTTVWRIGEPHGSEVRFVTQRDERLYFHVS